MDQIPGENSKVLQEEIEWQGEGWYCTTRTYPGSNTYKTWKILDEEITITLLPDEREAWERSLGGPLKWLRVEQDPSQAAAALGKSTSPAKARAARANGRKGGAPRKV